MTNTPLPVRRYNRIVTKKHKINNKNIIILFLVFTFIMTTIVIANNLPSKDKEPPTTINGILLNVDILDKTHPFRTNEIRRVKHIVIHETANENVGSNARQHNIYIHKNTTRQVSWHYTVDDEEIFKHLPDNEVAWHAGDGKAVNGGNMNGIGIEMCVNGDGDFKKTQENTSELVAFLLKEYGLNINDVKRHQDFSGKNCPDNIIKSGGWDNFLNLVKNKL